MIYNPKFVQKHHIDRRMKHGKCRYDEKKPTGRFCAYWKIRICEKNCDDCKKGKTLSL